jgi:peptidoglycan/xylan/chitin deacetylase (PgdA/CDA1 family)
VDDGSTDGTGELARELSAADARVAVLEAVGGGVSAARNLGLERADAPWVLFLDADDWLTPAALSCLHGRATALPELDVVHARWRLVLPDGSMLPPKPLPTGEPFPQLARTDPFPVQACLLRRELVARLAGFDTSLGTCEGWDLLQRLARSGARFGGVDEVVALYRIRADSAMSNIDRVVRNAVRVIERGHSPDERVPTPDPRFAAGADPSELPAALLEAAAWLAAFGIGHGADPSTVLGASRGGGHASLDPTNLAASIAEAVPRGFGASSADWLSLWPQASDRIDELLGELATLAGTPGLAPRARSALERMVLEHARPSELAVVGRAAGMDVDLGAPLADVRPPDGVEKVVLGLVYGGARVGALELPVCDGLVPAEVIADAAADAAGWPLVCRVLGAGDAEGWTVFLRELWGEPDLDDADFYGDPPSPGRLERLRLAVSGRDGGPRREALEVSGPLPSLRGPAELAVEIGGVPVGIVDVPAGTFAPGDLRNLVIDALGMELCRAAVREGIVGRPPGEPGLRERLQAAAGAGERGPAEPGEVLVLGRRRPREFNSSACRRAALPSAAAGDLLAMADALGEPVAAGRAPGAARVAYRPELLYPEAGTPGGRAAERRAGGGARSLPILMYHRVAASGGRTLARWRVTPDQLDEQLAFVRSEGYGFLSLDDWHDALARRRPVPERSVCITFDDAYEDFAATAWPILRRHGLGAHLFVVTGEAGGWNRWDEAAGERLPLLAWDELARLRDEGVLIGSHTAEHGALAGLRPVEVVRELARSRLELSERLGLDADALAYPFGDVDRTVEHLAGACGFRVAVTIQPWRSRLGDRPLALPRLEVSNRTGVEELAAMLG